MKKIIVSKRNAEIANATTITEREVRNEVADLLQEFNHLGDDGAEARGIIEMYGSKGEFWANKNWLINAMANHPDYNGRLQIVQEDIPVKRHVNFDVAREFYEWCRGNRNGQSEEAVNAWRVMREVLAPFTSMYDVDFDNIEDIEEWEKANCTLSAERAKFLNEFGRNCGNFDLHLNSGMKVSKVVNKVGHLMGLDKIVDIKDHAWFDENGNYHEKKKDFGWNYKFARFADNCNPFLKHMTAVLSAHPCDYYTMSFGDSWASCHTIDKDNTRHCDRTYSGMYCAGTQSYALDGATLIYYYVNQATGVTEPEKMDKHKRVVVCVGADKFIITRVYPDGRDGGDKFLPETMARQLQDIMGVMFKLDNPAWLMEDSVAGRNINTASGSKHYRDYNEYSDNITSFLLINNRINRDDCIMVGHEPCCPDCGSTYTDSGYLRCDSCRRVGYTCQCCGSYIPEDEALIDNYGDAYCTDCAARCDCCGDVVNLDDIHRVGDDWYCSSCFEDRFFYCNDCEGATPIEDMQTTEDGYDLCEYCYNNNTHETDDGPVYSYFNVVTTIEGSTRYICRVDRCPECNNFTDDLEAHNEVHHAQMVPMSRADEANGNED